MINQRVSVSIGRGFDAHQTHLSQSTSRHLMALWSKDGTPSPGDQVKPLCGKDALNTDVIDVGGDRFLAVFVCLQFVNLQQVLK